MNTINIPPKYKKLLNILLISDNINKIKYNKKYKKPSVIEFLLYIIMSLKSDINRTILQILKLFLRKDRLTKMFILSISNIYVNYYRQKNNNIIDKEKEQEIFNEVYKKLENSNLINLVLNHLDEKIIETFFYYFSAILFGKIEKDNKYWSPELEKYITDCSMFEILPDDDGITQLEKFFGGITYNKINRWNEKDTLPLIISCDDINIPIPSNLEVFWGSDLIQTNDQKYVEKNVNKIYSYIVTQSGVKDEKDLNKLTQGFYAELIKNSLSLLQVLMKVFLVGIKAPPEVFYSDNSQINEIIKEGLLKFINNNIISNQNIKINNQDVDIIINPYTICEFKKMPSSTNKLKEIILKSVIDIIIGNLINLLLIYVMKIIKKYIKNAFVNKANIKIDNIKDLANKIFKKYSVPFL